VELKLTGRVIATGTLNQQIGLYELDQRAIVYTGQQYLRKDELQIQHWKILAYQQQLRAKISGH